MPKALRFLMLAIAVVSVPVYWWDARIRGQWDSDGVRATVAAVLVFVLERPVELWIRRHLARKRAREEREKLEREEAVRNAAKAEARRKRLEREEAKAEAERRRMASAASAAWAKKQKGN